MIELLFAVVNASVSEVIMKMTAAPVVSLDRKLCAAPRTEHGLGSSAEGRADISTLAFLQKDH